MRDDKRLFLLEVSEIFANNEFSNALFVNCVTDESSSIFSKSKNTYYNKEKQTIELIDLNSEGEYLTDNILTDTKFGGTLNNFFLIVKESEPLETSISYFIILSDNRMFPIKPNHNEPFKVYGKQPTSFKILAKIKSKNNKIPSISGIAVLYTDSMVTDNLGLFSPNLRPTGDVEEEKTFLEFEE